MQPGTYISKCRQ